MTRRSVSEKSPVYSKRSSTLQERQTNACRLTSVRPCRFLSILGVRDATRGGIFTIVGARVNVRVRRRLYESLVRQEIGFFDTTKTGDLTSRLASDCTKIGDQVTLNVNVFLRLVFSVAPLVLSGGESSLTCACLSLPVSSSLLSLPSVSRFVRSRCCPYSLPLPHRNSRRTPRCVQAVVVTGAHHSLPKLCFMFMRHPSGLHEPLHRLTPCPNRESATPPTGRLVLSRFDEPKNETPPPAGTL